MSLGTVAGYSGEQLRNAAAIMAATTGYGLDRQAQVLAVMCAMGESSLRNIGYGDYETGGVLNPDGTPTSSIGLFQQQKWWGTVEQRLDPIYATRAFLERLVKVPSWRTLTPSLAIHRVQINANPDHYTKWQTPASQVVDAITDYQSKGGTDLSTLRFEDGAYNQASGTRDAFGGLSDALVREGYPAMVSVSGDREHSTQVRTFVSRFRQQASGVGAYNDVRYWDGTADGYPGGTRWVRVSGDGTVAPPDTSDHEKRRSNDLAYPYDRDTPAHSRARELAASYSIVCDGILFREWWHWTYRGALGVIGGSTAGTGSSTFEGALIVNKDDVDFMNGMGQSIKDDVINALTAHIASVHDSVIAGRADTALVNALVAGVKADVNYIHTLSPYSLKAIQAAAGRGEVKLTDTQAAAIAGQLSAAAVVGIDAALKDDFDGVKARLALLPAETIAALKSAL